MMNIGCCIYILNLNIVVGKYRRWMNDVEKGMIYFCFLWFKIIY